MHRKRRTVPAVLAALAAVTLCTAARPGDTADPVPLIRTGQVTDKVHAVGRRAPQVRTAVRRLYAARRIQLFVAYVSTFDGRTPQDWANATAVRNGLGRSDVLLAVATRDRQYAVSADQDAGLTQTQLDEVGDGAIEPALRENDWAGVAIWAASGYEAVLSGRPVIPPAVMPGAADPGRSVEPGTGNGAGDLWIPVVAVAAAGAVGAYAYRRRRTGPPARGGGPAPTGQIRGWGAKRPTPLTPLPELDSQARQLLVATDDAVRTSQEDVGFAAAQCGDEAARPFAEAVAYARGELTAAFRLRQKLDDAYPEDDETRRQMLDEILSRCTQANRRLDAESPAFDRLRAMEANAPRVLEGAEATAAALPGRIAAAEAALGPLAQRYADAALEPVAGHPAEARERLEFARTVLDQARAALATDPARAPVFLRAAEGALAQATTLADAVPRRERELRTAATTLRTALADTEADLAAVRALLAAPGQENPGSAYGSAGAAGTAGTAGTDSPRGTDGPVGTDGPRGAGSPDAADRTRGTSGTNGPPGTDGTRGPGSPDGTDGPRRTDSRAGTESSPRGTRSPDAADRTRGTDPADRPPGTDGSASADNNPDAAGCPRGTDSRPGTGSPGGAGGAVAGVWGGVERVEAVLVDVGKELAAGRYDPLTCLRRVVAADAGLEASLGGVRDEEGVGGRVRALLEQAVPGARSEVAAARDLITTHRGAIGCQARTRLTEAERRLRQAELSAPADPAGALEHTRAADLLAREAQEIARRDVAEYGEYRAGRRSGEGMSGAVLGGILLGGVRTGGGGGLGGGLGTPGSFGGGETRGRLGGGGGF